MSHTKLVWLVLVLPALAAAWPAVGDTAPNFIVQDTANGWHTLYADRGHTLLLYWWRVDVPPCTTFLPRIQAMYDDYAPRGFRVLAIHWSGEMEQVRPCARRYSYGFYLDAGNAFQVYPHGDSLPLCYVLDTASWVVYSSGVFDDTLLRNRITSVLPPAALAESPGSAARTAAIGPTIVRGVLNLPEGAGDGQPTAGIGLLDIAGRRVLRLRPGTTTSAASPRACT